MRHCLFRTELCFLWYRRIANKKREIEANNNIRNIIPEVLKYKVVVWSSYNIIATNVVSKPFTKPS